jgi:hypothetical protein
MAQQHHGDARKVSHSRELAKSRRGDQFHCHPADQAWLQLHVTPSCPAATAEALQEVTGVQDALD